MEVTTDEYELPVAVAEDAYNLGKMVGVKKQHNFSGNSAFEKIWL